MLLWLRSGIISSVEGIWLDVPLTWPLVICENVNLCSLLDSGRQTFHWSKLTMLSPWVQPWDRGRSAGSFPEQRLVIEPNFLREDLYLNRVVPECQITTKSTKRGINADIDLTKELLKQIDVCGSLLEAKRRQFLAKTDKIRCYHNCC